MGLSFNICLHFGLAQHALLVLFQYRTSHGLFPRLSPKTYFLKSNYVFSKQHALITVCSSSERVHSEVRNMETHMRKGKAKQVK